MLACKSFKKASIGLGDTLAVLAKRLCTKNIDPLTIEPILGKLCYPTRQRKRRSAANWGWRGYQENNQKVCDERDKGRYR